MTTVKERLTAFLTHKNLSHRAFEQSVGLSNGYVNNIRRSIQPSKIQIIAKQYPELNTGWLLTGEGEMLKPGHGELVGELVPLTAGDIAVMYVPLVSQYAYAGYLSGFLDSEYVDKLPRIPFIVEHEGKGEYLCFEVRGDSMDDGTPQGYVDGEILLCREIDQVYWTQSRLHMRKWDFVIVSRDEGILLKRIINHDPDSGTVIIHSLNDFYNDKIVNLQDISKIFNVITSMKKRRF